MSEVVTQEKLDAALVAVAKHANGEINLNELELAVSYEVGNSLSKTGLANFRMTPLASGRYRFRFTALPQIMPAGVKRLEELSSK